ncbi:MAG: phage major capsid protein [Lewinella sp.]|uniref:phage major capsid protein n=1 Tax=Lewinella sp. TaxID=2004506 RepID=UPI003D6BD84A
MSNRIKALEEQLGEKRTALLAIDTTCENESRARTEEEVTKWNALEADMDTLNGELRAAKKAEEARAEEARKVADAKKAAAAVAGGSEERFDNSETKEKQKVMAEYRWADAIQVLMGKKPLDGAVKELHDQAENEVRGTRIGYEGLAIPASFENLEQRTDIDQATADIQPTVVNQFHETIRQRSVLEQVIPSNNIMRGLTADVKMNKVNKNSVAWASAENSAASDVGANPTSITLNPDARITGYVDISNQVILQNTDAVINAHMTELARGIAVLQDNAAFSTANVSNAYGSIAATSGVLTFTEAAAYAAPSATVNGSIYDDYLAALQELANGDVVPTAFVGHTKLMSDLHKSPRVISVASAADPGVDDGLFRYNMDGRPFFLTTSNTSNGSTSADFIAGDFSKAFLAYFGGIDMTLDAISTLLNDQKRIVVHRRVDLGVTRGEAFVKAVSLLS